MDTLALAVAGTFIGLGAYTLAWWRKNVLKSRAASAWSAVSGTIVESCISRPAAHDDSEVLVVRFRYELGGKDYASDRIDLFRIEERINGEEMRELLERYRRGRQVRVYCDPADPATGVLEPGNLLAARRVRNLGMVLIAIGLLILVMASQFS